MTKRKLLKYLLKNVSTFYKVSGGWVLNMNLLIKDEKVIKELRKILGKGDRNDIK